MSILYKRLLIFFSVALNIGFVVMVVGASYHHSNRAYKHSWKNLTNIVNSLDLSEDEERSAMDSLMRFKDAMNKHDKDLKKARHQVILFLAEPGSLNKQNLRTLIENVDQQEKIRREFFEAHVLDIRSKLGPEKGPLFFSMMAKGFNHEGSSTSQ